MKKAGSIACGFEGLPGMATIPGSTVSCGGGDGCENE